MKVLTNFTARTYPHKREHVNPISETMPGQSITPQELLRRYATGQPLGFKNATPVYDDDDHFDVPELYKMDKLDRLHELQSSSNDLIQKRTDFQKAVHKFKSDQKIANEKENKLSEPKNEVKKEPATQKPE